MCGHCGGKHQGCVCGIHVTLSLVPRPLSFFTQKKAVWARDYVTLENWKHAL